MENDQDAATSILRGILDNVAMTNNPRIGIVDGAVNIDDVLKISSNDKSLVVMHQEGYYADSHFFILSLEDEDGMVAKSINLEEAKKLVAYLNAHIILAENND